MLNQLSREHTQTHFPYSDISRCIVVDNERTLNDLLDLLSIGYMADINCILIMIFISVSL